MTRLLTQSFGAVSRARQHGGEHGGDLVHLGGEVVGKRPQATRCRDVALVRPFESEMLGSVDVTRAGLNVRCLLVSSGHSGVYSFGPRLDYEGALPQLLQRAPR